MSEPGTIQRLHLRREGEPPGEPGIIERLPSQGVLLFPAHPEVRPPGRLSLGRPDTLAHAAVGGVVIEATPTDVRYPGAEPDALIDGRVGSGDFRDGRWLAYDGVDFEATLDLGTPQTVARVGIDCLQVQSAWILLPRVIRASVSTDGQAWRDLPALRVALEADDRVEARLLSVDVGGAPVRYIRVHATNTQPLPEWHPGAGETGWIFVDEIVVDTT